jgi:hypothetical protein
MASNQGDPMQPTPEAYGELQRAFSFFNTELFHNKLPDCLITLQREKRSRGYFSSSRFVHHGGTQVDEIAMNPSYFGVVSPRETLSTLAHEMTHSEQYHFGKPGRRGYHNKAWGKLMEAIGLMPSATGQPGGPRTGEQMTHYIIEGGPFERACEQLLSEEFRFSWFDRFPAARPRPQPSITGDPAGDMSAARGATVDPATLELINLPPEGTAQRNRSNADVIADSIDI